MPLCGQCAGGCRRIVRDERSLVPPNRPVMRLAGSSAANCPVHGHCVRGGHYEPSHAIGSAQD